VKRALVIVARYLGDTLLALPAADALARAGYAVEWLVPPASAPLLQGQPLAHEVHLLHRQGRALWETAKKLWRRFSVACVLTPSDRAMVMAAAAAKSIVAPIIPRWQEWWKRRLADAWIAPSMARHVVAEAATLAEMAGGRPASSLGVPFFVAPKAEATARALLREIKRPVIAVHPFARWPYKAWPAASWRALLQRLAREGFAIVISAAPDERKQAQALAEGIRHVRVIAGELSWQALGALYRHAHLYIGLDTMNTHLAAAVGARVIALFGPTDPRRWGPWPNGFHGPTPWRQHASSGVQRQGNLALLQGRADCIPCHREGCNATLDSRSRCLDEEITPERVVDAMEKLLEMQSR